MLTLPTIGIIAVLALMVGGKLYYLRQKKKSLFAHIDVPYEFCRKDIN